MAKIIGRPASEKEILKRCSEDLQSFEEIGKNYRTYNNQLEDKRGEFYDRLPEKIENEKEKLNEIENRKEMKIKEYENKIREIRNKVTKNKENKKWFSVISNHFQIFFKKYISKPWNVRKIKKEIGKQKEKLNQLKENPEKIFEQQNDDMISRINHLEKIMNDPLYAGAQGEIKVLNKLSKLNDNYRVLCGLEIELDDYISYEGKKNLKSAQMDFVVVSHKGVFLIEVKNWGNRYTSKNTGFSPHEQLDRAGRVLYVFLESRLGDVIPLLQEKIQFDGKRLTKVLIPIQNNITYDRNYKYVLISSVSELNNFIQDREDVYDQKEVKKITETLKRFVTERDKSIEEFLDELF